VDRENGYLSSEPFIACPIWGLNKIGFSPNRTVGYMPAFWDDLRKELLRVTRCLPRLPCHLFTICDYHLSFHHDVGRKECQSSDFSFHITEHMKWRRKPLPPTEFQRAEQRRQQQSTLKKWEGRERSS
jgi:hypothetical protein